jgi:hypothetical protein
MRVYAVLLGVLLTAGSAYLAEVAVASAGFERLAGPSPRSGDLTVGGELWYGGVIDPITIEAPRRVPWTRRNELAAGPSAHPWAR